MGKTNQANFRVDADLWEKFKDKAIANDSTATAELCRFIAAYVSGDVSLGEGDSLSGENLDIRIGTSIQAVIAPLLKRIERLEAIATAATEPAENDDVAENSPSRMAPVEQKAIAIENHPRDTEQAATVAETRELLTNAQFVEAAQGLGLVLTRNHATKWKKAGKFPSTPKGQTAARFFGVIEGEGFYLLA